MSDRSDIGPRGGERSDVKLVENRVSQRYVAAARRGRSGKCEHARGAEDTIGLMSRTWIWLWRRTVDANSVGVALDENGTAEPSVVLAGHRFTNVTTHELEPRGAWRPDPKRGATRERSGLKHRCAVCASCVPVVIRRRRSGSQPMRSREAHAVMVGRRGHDRALSHTPWTVPVTLVSRIDSRSTEKTGSSRRRPSRASSPREARASSSRTRTEPRSRRCPTSGRSLRAFRSE